jgi:hypothetical protein
MDRDELFHQWGPQLLEATCLVLLDEINILRDQLSLPQRTKEQALNAVASELTDCPPYSWMENIT